MADAPIQERVTRLLNLANAGDAQAAQELGPLLHVELRRLAGRFMQSERPEHTLQPTALVHEAWMRFVEPSAGSWENRAQFFRMASRVMRSVLVDHARARKAIKRGGGREPVALDDEETPPVEGATDRSDYYLALDEALARLAERDPPLAQIAELHLFGGLELAEVARALELSTRKVERGWRTARAWLRRKLE